MEMHEDRGSKRLGPPKRTLTAGGASSNVICEFFLLDGSAMKKYNTSHKLLLAAWLLFCGSLVAGLLFIIGWVGGHPVDPLLAILVGVAAIPFVWMLSSGWRDADLFKRALRTYVREREKGDA